MKNITRSIYIAFSLLAAASAHAQVTVKDAWVRATVPQQRATGAFMQLNAAKDSKLVSASSSLTAVVEVHEMTMQDHIMRMRQIPAYRVTRRQDGGTQAWWLPRDVDGSEAAGKRR